MYARLWTGEMWTTFPRDLRSSASLFLVFKNRGYLQMKLWSGFHISAQRRCCAVALSSDSSSSASRRRLFRETVCWPCGGHLITRLDKSPQHTQPAVRTTAATPETPSLASRKDTQSRSIWNRPTRARPGRNTNGSFVHQCRIRPLDLADLCRCLFVSDG